jgi:hypothetical protein
MRHSKSIDPDWVQVNGKALTDQDKAEWNQIVLTFGPKNEQVQKVYNCSKTRGANRPASQNDVLV